MRRVMLVTLQSDNIGNRLQNYALQSILEKLGCQVVTPIYDPVEINTLKKKIKNELKVILAKAGVRKYQQFGYRRQRINRYRKFDKKYISNRFKIRHYKVPLNRIKNVDYVITGSDQVWHRWSDNKQELSYFYLQFVPSEKRISYAASFGFDSFPDEDVLLHKNGLDGICKLSCREKEGQKIIKDLTGKEARLVLDPTLLIPKDEWIKIQKPSSLYMGRPYLLLYFMGNMEPYRDAIKEFAMKKGIDVIDAFNRDDLQSFMTTPDEFVWLINNASYVCTDSFHATVFSIIFEKSFLAFKRIEAGMEKMFDRIQTLLEMYRMNDRIYSGNMNVLCKDIIDCNISIQVDKSISFLSEALNIY